MIEEHEEDRPEWEIEDEKVPPSLEKKWEQEEKEGLKAGVCRSCGRPFTKEDLSCRHCEAPVEMTDGVIVSLRRWFFKTPLGILMLIFIFMGLFFYLVHL